MGQKIQQCAIKAFRVFQLRPMPGTGQYKHSRIRQHLGQRLECGRGRAAVLAATHHQRGHGQPAKIRSPPVERGQGLQRAPISTGIHLAECVFGQPDAFGQSAGAHELRHQGLRELLHGPALLQRIHRFEPRCHPVIERLCIQRRATATQHQPAHQRRAPHSDLQRHHRTHAVPHEGDRATLQQRNQLKTTLGQGFEGVGLDRGTVAITGHIPRHRAVAGGGQGLDLGRKREMPAIGVVQHHNSVAGAEQGEGRWNSHARV